MVPCQGVVVGLYYYRLRYYDPAVGRFISRDPLGMWGDPSQLGNGQAYARNNPVNLVDPYGDRTVLGTGPGIDDSGPTVKDRPLTRDERIHNLRLRAESEYWQREKAKWRAQAGEALKGLGLAILEETPLDLLVSALEVLTAEDWCGALLWEAAGLVPFVDLLKRYRKLQRKLDDIDAEFAAGPRNRSEKDHTPNPGGCFLAGTLVLTPAGPKPIEEIKAGDLVLSRNEETGEVGYKRVIQTFPGGNVAVCEVTVARTHRTQDRSDGEDDENQQIRCTPDHPFFALGRGWVRADKLRVGDRLVGAEDEALVVVATKVWRQKVPTWNFQVADWESYFVAGGAGRPFVWVHNTGPGDCFPKGDWDELWKKHTSEFEDYGLVDPEDLPHFVRDLKAGEKTRHFGPDELDPGSLGSREAWFDPESGFLVIEEGGEVRTVFRPETGESYFDRL